MPAPRADAPCPFCAIVEGRAQAQRVFADDEHLAFLDTRPLFHGHVLLVPRLHVRKLDELPRELAPGFFALAQDLESAVERAMDADGSLVLINNVVSQSVPHLHLHVIPRRRGDGLRFWLGPRKPYDSDAHMAEVAGRLREALAAVRQG